MYQGALLGPWKPNQSPRNGPLKMHWKDYLSYGTSYIPNSGVMEYEIENTFEWRAFQEI
jgi:hypothetical protein